MTPSPRATHRRWMSWFRLATWCGLLVSLLAVRASAADEPPRRLQRVDVPADRPELWPEFSKSLVAMPRQEFERLYAARQPRAAAPPNVMLPTARYSATVLGDGLVNGSLQWEVVRRSDRPAWMNLSPTNLAYHDLSWTDGPAIWGAGSDGRLWLSCDRARDTIRGGWEAVGQRLADQLSIPLKFPPAESTTLMLSVPPGYAVSADDLPVRTLAPEPSSSLARWEVLLGSQTECRLQITRQDSATESPVVIVQRQLMVAVREDHLRFQAVFTPEVLGGEIQTVKLTVPNAVEVYSVTWGNELPLAWSRKRLQTARDTITVTLPEPVRGVLRPIRLEGILSQRPGATTSVPLIEWVDGIFRSGEMKVSVSQPLQIASIRAIGCRQQSPVVSTSEGESYAFQQTTPESLLAFELRRPRSTLTAQVLSSVQRRASDWLQQTEILWTSTTGIAFQASLRIPRGWEMTDVDAFTETGQEERISWELIRDPDGGTRLAIEFLEALSPGSPRRMSVWARRRHTDAEVQVECPIIRPLDCQSVDAVLVLDGQKHRFVTEPQARLQLVSPDRLPDSWRSFPLWTSLIASPREYQTWIASRELEQFGTLRIDALPDPVEADVLVSVQALTPVLSETFDLAIRPVSRGTLDRVLVALTEPGTDITWEVLEPADLSIVGQRIPVDRSQYADTYPQGELWELKFPSLDAREVKIRGTRARTLSAPTRIALAFVPQARQSSNLAQVELSDSLRLQCSTRGLEDIPDASSVSIPPTGGLIRQSRWRYGDPRDELLLLSRSTGPAEAPCIADMQLKSLLSSQSDGFDYHRALCRLPDCERPLRFELSGEGELLVARLNDEPLAVDDRGVILVSPQRGSGFNRLELFYRAPQPAGFLTDTRTLSVPRSEDVIWRGFRWEFALPPELRLAGEPVGTHLAESPPGPSWTMRLFGPIGRETGSLFIPWQQSSWSELLKPPAAPSVVESSLDADLATPAKWATYVAFAPGPPIHPRLTTWHWGRARLLAWFFLLAALTIGLSLRAFGWGLRDRATAVGLALTVAATLMLDAPWTQFTGAIIAGTTLAVLIPRRWVGLSFPQARPNPDVPVGSTQSFTIPGMAASPGSVSSLLGVIVLSGLGALIAAEPPISPEHIVLVLVDDNDRPSTRLPLVYISRETETWLRSAPTSTVDEPTWLVESATMDAQLGTPSRVQVKATFVVTVLGNAEQLLLPVRLPDVNLSGVAPCLVDGLPATITALPDNVGIEVLLTRSDRPVSAIGIEHDRHQITLSFTKPLARSVDGLQLLLPIPSAPRTQLHLVGTPPSPGPAATTEPRPESASEPQRHLVAGTQQSEFRLVWPAAAPNPTLEPKLECTEIWDVGAGVIDVRSRTRLVPQSGSRRRFIAELPEGATLRDSSPSMAYRLLPLPSRNRVTRILVEVAEPFDKPVTIDLGFALPLPTQQGEIDWRGVHWRSAGISVEDGPSLAATRRVWAFLAPPEMQIQPRELENSGLVPLTREAAKETLGGLTGDRQPRSVYQVGTEAPIPFQWSQATSRRRLLLWQQTGTLGPDRLKWELEGDLEVQGAPVYSHTLVIDRRLQIESISIRERGTERLARASETRLSGSPPLSRLTLLLSDPCVEPQRILITASMPVSPTSSVVLPNIRCEDAELLGGRVVLRSQIPGDILWQNVKGLRELPTPDEATRAAGPRSWIFDQAEVDWRTTIKLQSQDATVRSRALHLLVSESLNSIELVSRWQVPVRPGGGELTVRVPAPWELLPNQESSQAVVRLETMPDGGGIVSVTPDSNARDVMIELHARVPRSAVSRGTLPLPVLNDAPADLSTWIVDRTPPVLIPVVETDADLAEIPEPSEWTLDWADQLATLPDVGSRWFKLPSGRSSLRLVESGETTPPPMTWLEHSGWLQSGRLIGRTKVSLAKPTAVITSQIATPIVFKGAIVDQQSAVYSQPSEHEIRIAAPNGAAFVDLELLWELDSVEVGGLISVSDLTWPQFANAARDELAFTLYPESQRVPWPRSPWRQIDWVDYALIRLHALGDHATVAGRSRVRARQIQRYKLAADQLARVPGKLSPAHPERESRWLTVIDQINSFPAADFSIDNPDLVGPQRDDELMDHPLARHALLDGSVTSFRLWTFDHAWLKYLSGCALVLLLLPVFTAIVRRDVGEWLKSRPNLATALLGTVWWVCLSPSMFGFTLLMWAAYRSTFGRTEPSAPFGASSPSEISGAGSVARGVS